MGFEHLKPGDKVLILSRNSGHLGIVDKVTKTQIVVGSHKFNKATGNRIPYEPWSNIWIREATPEIEAEFVAKAKKIKSISLSQNITDSLRKDNYKKDVNLDKLINSLEKILSDVM